MSFPRNTKFPRSVLIVNAPTRPDGVCESMLTLRTTPGFPPGTDVYEARYRPTAGVEVDSGKGSRPPKARCDIAVVAIRARNAITDLLEIGDGPGPPDLVRLRRRASAGRMVRRIDHLPRILEHQPTSRFDGVRCAWRLSLDTSVHLIEHSRRDVVGDRSARREMNVRIAARGDRLSLYRRGFGGRPRANLERNDAPKVLVYRESIDDGDTAVCERRS